MNSLTRSSIDRAGKILARNDSSDEIRYIQSEDIFDEYRKRHLKPLSETTIDIQRLLHEKGGEYFIAQRLKRRPQIIRKLNRLSVRLSQLQDIGGCRVIVPKNSDVDRVWDFFKRKSDSEFGFSLERAIDYRERGRDDTGYRALHLILKRDGFSVELQVRSHIQHYWAESIERTSVVYGFHLKEKEGDPEVISYFKKFSDALYELESGRQPSSQSRYALEASRKDCEEIIKENGKGEVLESFVNEGIIRTLVEKESNRSSGLNNWILIFDWNLGNFVSWDIVGNDPDEAFSSYIRAERDYPSQQGFEVVLIGSSNVSTVRKTHSHYFGIERHSDVLQGFESSVLGLRKSRDIDVDSGIVLSTLHRRHLWGRKKVSFDTLKNHFCKNVFDLEEALDELIKRGFVLHSSSGDGYSLDIRKKAQIEQYL